MSMELAAGTLYIAANSLGTLGAKFPAKATRLHALFPGGVGVYSRTMAKAVVANDNMRDLP